MRLHVMFAALLLLVPLGSARAQDRYPVTIGAGGGVLSGSAYHGLLLVGITPARSPIGLRLDGLLTPPNQRGRMNSELLSAVSASAVITLRPWRVAPYLLVGATRTASYATPSLLSPSVYYNPARTELTGGLGLSMRWRGANMFGEMRNLKESGTALTFGVTF